MIVTRATYAQSGLRRAKIRHTPVQFGLGLPEIFDAGIDSIPNHVAGVEIALAD